MSTAFQVAVVRSDKLDSLLCLTRAWECTEHYVIYVGEQEQVDSVVLMLKRIALLTHMQEPAN